MEVNLAALPDQLKSSKQSLQLLTENTTNGKKVQIALEELHELYGLTWETHLIDLEKGEHKKDWYLKINPNGRIPVLIDTKGSPVSIMESSAILTYLQENYDTDNRLGFTSPSETSQLQQWLFFWQAAAPIQGQTRRLTKNMEEKAADSDVVQYFQAEVLRIYSVLNDHLSGRHKGPDNTPRLFLAGNGQGKYSIADIGTWPHVRAYRSLGFLTEEAMCRKFPYLAAWIERVAERSAVKEGIKGDKYDSEDCVSRVLTTS